MATQTVGEEHISSNDPPTEETTTTQPDPQSEETKNQDSTAFVVNRESSAGKRMASRSPPGAGMTASKLGKGYNDESTKRLFGNPPDRSDVDSTISGQSGKQTGKPLADASSITLTDVMNKRVSLDDFKAATDAELKRKRSYLMTAGLKTTGLDDDDEDQNKQDGSPSDNNWSYGQTGSSVNHASAGSFATSFGDHSSHQDLRPQNTNDGAKTHTAYSSFSHDAKSLSIHVQQRKHSSGNGYAMRFPSRSEKGVTRDLMIDDFPIPEASRFLPVTSQNLDVSGIFRDVLEEFDFNIAYIMQSEGKSDKGKTMVEELAGAQATLDVYYNHSPPADDDIEAGLTVSFSPYSDPGIPTYFNYLFGYGELSWDEGDSRALMVSILQALKIDLIADSTRRLCSLLKEQYDAFHPMKILSLSFADFYAIDHRYSLDLVYRLLVYCYFQGCCVAWFGAPVHPGLFNQDIAAKIIKTLPNDYVIDNPEDIFQDTHPIWQIMKSIGRRYGIPENGVFASRTFAARGDQKTTDISRITQDSDVSITGAEIRSMVDKLEDLQNRIAGVPDRDKARQFSEELEDISRKLQTTMNTSFNTKMKPRPDPHSDFSKADTIKNDVISQDFFGKQRGENASYVQVPDQKTYTNDRMSVMHDRWGLLTNIKKDPDAQSAETYTRHPPPASQSFRMGGGPQYKPITPEVPAFRSPSKRDPLPVDRVPGNWYNRDASRNRRDDAERNIKQHMDAIKNLSYSTPVTAPNTLAPDTLSHTKDPYDGPPASFQRTRPNPRTMASGQGGGHGDDGDDDPNDHNDPPHRPPWPIPSGRDPSSGRGYGGRGGRGYGGGRGHGGRGGGPPSGAPGGSGHGGGNGPPYGGGSGGGGSGPPYGRGSGGGGTGGYGSSFHGYSTGGGSGGGDGGGGGPPGGPSGYHHGSRYDPVTQFRRGQKRDASVFMKLKHDSHFYAWKRHVTANLIAQDCGDVLSYKYVPHPHTVEGEVDRLKNDYVFAILTGTLDTPKGRSLLMAYEDSRDARAVWTALVEYYTQSTFAVVLSQQIMTWLTTMRLGIGKWTKTTHEFVLAFEEKVDLYNNMQRRPEGRILDDQAMSMLQTAVSQQRELAQVQSQLETAHITTGVQANYTMYRQLLLSACVKVDRMKATRSNLNANAAEFIPNGFMDDDFSDESIPLDDNDDLPDYEAHQIRMDKQTWQQIPAEDQKAWDTMSPAGKQVVLGFAAKGPPAKGKRRADRSRNRSRSVHFADQETPLADSSESADDSPSHSEDTNDDTRIVRNIIANHHPASLSRVLSSDTDTSTKTSSSDSVSHKRDVHMSMRYVVSKHARSHCGALIDRGANGGMAGSDTRTISHTGDYCDLSGIDNHEMTHIPLVTAGAVVRTNNGDVIVILHNYAKVPGHKTIHSAHQLADNGVTVDDRHHMEGGSHCVITPEGYKIPLSFRNGLAYMDMRAYTDAEFDLLPHVHLTSAERWRPDQHDFEIDDGWFEVNPPTPVRDPPMIRPHGRSPFTAVNMVDLLDDTSFRDEFVTHDMPSPDILQAYSVLSSPADGERLSRPASAESRSACESPAPPPAPDLPSGNGESLTPDLPSGNGESLTTHTVSVGTDHGESLDSVPNLPDSASARVDHDVSLPVPLDKVADCTPVQADLSDGYVSQRDLRKSVRRFISDSAYSRLPMTCMIRSMDKAFWVGAERILHDDALSDDQKAAALGELHIRACTSHTPGELLDGAPFDACRHDSIAFTRKKKHKLKARGVYVGTRASKRKEQESSETPATPDTSKTAVAESPSKGIDDINEQPEVEEKYATDQADLIARMSPLFFGASPLITARTLKATTQFGTRRGLRGLQLRNTYRAPNPALNIQRRQEPVATDTIYSDTPAVDCGHTYCQIFLGVRSKVLSAHGCSTDGEFVKTLLEEIRKRGAPDILISDNAKAESSEQVKDVLRQYAINDWQSEANFQHQNPVERRWGTAKACVSRLMNISGADANAWLLAVQHVFMVLNCMALKSLGYRTPNEHLTGVTPDISALMEFHFWEPVYYKKSHDKWEKFPSQSDEARGRWVGVSENVGHAMTYKILTDDTKKIICRSVIRSADPEWAKNRRIDPDRKEAVLFERQKGRPFPTFNPADLYGRTFMTLPDDQGHQQRAEIVGSSKLLQSDKIAPGDHPAELVKWRYRVGDDIYEEVMAYSRMLSFVTDDEIEPGFHRLDSIVNHRKKGRSWEVQIRWEDGTYSWNDLSDLALDDEISCAVYARAKGLLDEPGWKRFRTTGSKANMKKLYRQVHRTKLKSYRAQPIYKFGELVPRNYQEARRYDEMNRDHGWSDAEKLELSQLIEYKAYYSLGLDAKIPEGHTLILVHFVYDRKICGRKKARLVANGNMTETPIESTYSGVVSLRGLRMMFFIAELNGLELWATDIGNAYLESLTDEKIVFRAGPEFGKEEGHLMKIHKALYGLKTSSARWHERLADILRDMDFFPSRADPDIWMRDKGNHYEYIGVYVDDLAIASKDPQKIIDCLLNEHNLKLKGTGPLSYHLGCDYFRDKHGILCGSPRTYVDKLIDSYGRMFGTKPRMTYASPIEKGDHPELDTSPLLDEKGIMRYQSMLGALQWIVSIGRLDIATAVMSMGSFRVAPREGHLRRLQRIYGYLARMKHATIRYRTGIPDYSQIEFQTFDWERSVYGGVKEQCPNDAPRPMGKKVVQSTYVDANLMHNVVSGHSVTGVLHLLNQTPIDYYTRKQATVETSTYGSEFVAARTAVQQIQDMRLMLRYLGVKIESHAYLFGDNEAVVKSGSIPYSRLSKRHIALSYHYVREAVASGMVKFAHIPGDLNPADILSKHWGYSNIWPMLKALLFYEGNTALILTETKPVQKKPKEEMKEQQQSGRCYHCRCTTHPTSPKVSEG